MDYSATDIITIKDSKFGKGIFSLQTLSKGTIIIKVRGEKLNFSDSLELGAKESYCLQVGMDDYIIPDEPFIYSNHSCDPNAGLNHKLELVALRPILPGEEICWDYSTSMLERHWTMRCHCGSPFCRHHISDFDFLPKHTQKFYLHLRIVLPFIISYLEESSSVTGLVNMK
ncbi:MAG: SET domain-containing protein [Flavitalea sp.]